jgi:hypothetical protein
LWIGRSPLAGADQVSLIVVFETGVARRQVGADGAEDTVAGTIVDVGDLSAAVSGAVTA